MTTTADPAWHMLSTWRHYWDEHGRPASDPVPVPVQVADYRRSLRTAAEQPPAPVLVPGAVALVAAALLREFAVRMRASAAGAGDTGGGEQLAHLAEELALELRYAPRPDGADDA